MCFFVCVFVKRSGSPRWKGGLCTSKRADKWGDQMQRNSDDAACRESGSSEEFDVILQLQSVSSTFRSRRCL